MIYILKQAINCPFLLEGLLFGRIGIEVDSKYLNSSDDSGI